MSKEISTKELSEIIVKAIQDEPYFTKDVLVPRIKALISGFRLNIDSLNYDKVYDDRGTAKLIRSNKLHNLEKDFWKQLLKSKVGSENMQQYYDLLDIERSKWNCDNE